MIEEFEVFDNVSKVNPIPASTGKDGVDQGGNEFWRVVGIWFGLGIEDCERSHDVNPSM